jgi:phage tail-like protein
MANPANETVIYPFSAFNFAFEINVPDVGAICNAAFAECDGLEMTREVKSLREGGNNNVQYRLAGPAAFGTLSLKRGMTESFDLWKWFEASLFDPSLRADGHVVIFSAGPGKNGEKREKRASFLLTACLPVKLKAPALNAKDGMVAIEEFQLVYESINLEPKAN